MTTSTWNSAPESGDWSDANNWTPCEVPNTLADFKASSQCSIDFSSTEQASINTIKFSEEAPAYTFNFGVSQNPLLTISGRVENNSGTKQSFIVAATSSGHTNPQLKFISTASAGGDDIYYCAGPIDESGYGGGVISFCDHAKAGYASFKVWTGAEPPPQSGSTVGGEVSFSDNTSAENANFIIYGTLGTDGDTFGNVVFHNNATAGNGNFTNIGGTVSGGDGGNTQFYGESTAAEGTFNNWGGTYPKSNGGDVAFDGTATGGNGQFYNHAATVEGAYGGVTSFNNNPPTMDSAGASAGYGCYFNYGACPGQQGGGGHTTFSARYGSPTAAYAKIKNYGSEVNLRSSAGHTTFSINLPSHDHFPTAGNATIWNYPAPKASGAAGYTTFSIYKSWDGKESTPSEGKVPTAGSATIINVGACNESASGGYTSFDQQTSAENSTLIAHGGTNGGYGGKIAFYNESLGASANVELHGNGELNISYHSSGVSIGNLDAHGGIISLQLGTSTTTLTVKGLLSLHSNRLNFSIWKTKDGGFEFNTAYTILQCDHLEDFSVSNFAGNAINHVNPTFTIVGNALKVSYIKE